MQGHSPRKYLMISDKGKEGRIKCRKGKEGVSDPFSGGKVSFFK